MDIAVASEKPGPRRDLFLKFFTIWGNHMEALKITMAAGFRMR